MQNLPYCLLDGPSSLISNAISGFCNTFTNAVTEICSISSSFRNGSFNISSRAISCVRDASSSVRKTAGDLLPCFYQ